MLPEVSIIIPVYNIENYIENCLESVLSQSSGQTEIICIDDGSTDSSAEKIKAMARNDSRIVYIHQENSGVSAARNTGLEAATGEYIFFLDGDDYLHTQAIEILLDCARKTGADMICSDYVITERKDCESVRYTDYSDSDTDFDTLFFKGNKLGKCCFAKLIKSDVAKQARFFEGVAMGEDGCYVVMLLNGNISVRVVDKPLYFYYVRQGSATKSALSAKKLTIVNAYDRLCDYVNNSANAEIRAFCLRSVFYQLNQKRQLFKGSEFEQLAETTCKKIGKKHLKAFLKEKNISPKVRLFHALCFVFPLLYKILLNK